MPYPVEKVTKDIKEADDYMALVRIREYLDAHAHEYPDDDGEYLKNILDERMEKVFQHPECSQIENISLRMRSGILSREWSSIGLSKAQSECAQAHELGIPLNEWLYEIYPDLLSFKVKIHVPSEYERELAREVLPSMETRRERKLTGIRREVPEAEGEVGVSINMPDLLNRYQSEIRELIEMSQENNERELERLRKEINALRARIETGQSETEPTNAPKEISRVLDTSQYDYFRRNAHKLGLPIRYEQIARGQYQVTIIVTSPDEEDKALTFIGEAEKHEREISRGEKAHLQGYEDIMKALCRNYEKESGRPCGLSRTGALSTLADRLLEYAASQGADWQALFDIGSIDLFAKRGQIYTREQADEAFNNVIAQIQGRNMRRNLEENEVSQCDPEIITGYILDYDAVATLISENPSLRENNELRKIMNDAISALSNCDFYPNRLDRAREEASAEFEHYGTSYEDQLNARIESLEKRYGG